MLTTKQKVAIASLLQSGVSFCRRLAGKGPLTRVKRRGLWWDIDLREGIEFSIWLTGAFEAATLNAYRKLIRPGDVVLDIGANIGAHTLHLAQAAGDKGTVYAFEPTDWAFAKLNDNIALNPALSNRIRCRQLMLLDRMDDAPPPPVYASWPLTETPGIHPLHRGQLMPATHARTSTLDAFLSGEGIERVDFVKIDIDGFECRMLRGAVETLSRRQPTIIIELSPHQLEEFGSSIEELAGLLADAGYELQDVISGAPLPLDGKRLRGVIAYGGSRNAIARPPASSRMRAE